MYPLRGVGFIDVIIGTAVIALVFLALTGVLRASLLVSSEAKSKAAAQSLAENEMEYIRGLTYDAIGTVGGIPSGSIAQTQAQTLDGAVYTIRTLIEYTDDPADGLGASDSNGITTDYKTVKVNVSYFLHGTTRNIALVSNFSPPGIESTNGGGTLQIKAVSASGVAVPGATVLIVNASTTPTVNLTTYTNLSGIVYLPGAATSTEYQVTVSGSGYSTAQTYPRTTQNQNPSPGYLTVVKNQTTTGTFAIDLLSTLALTTLSSGTLNSFFDTFNDSSQVASMNSAAVSGGALVGQAASASALAISVVNSGTWVSASASLSIPTNTSALVHLYDANGALLPDTVLSGNAAGFSTFPVNLSGIATTTYPSLALGVSFTGGGGALKPKVLDWTLTSSTGAVAQPNVAYTFTGAKTIGSTGAGAPIYKTALSGTTDGSGSKTLSLEWDTYTPSVTGYDITDLCPAGPYVLAPGTNTNAGIVVGPHTSNSLLVEVKDNIGTAVPGAQVLLTRTGFSSSVTSSLCGNSYFGSLTSSATYSVQISKSGYTTTTFTNVSVSGASTYVASFP
jgi:hypothetical protein